MHRKISSRRFKNTESAFGISVRNQRINKKPLFFQDQLNNAKTNYTIESIHEPNHCHRKLHPYDIDTKNLPKNIVLPIFQQPSHVWFTLTPHFSSIRAWLYRHWWWGRPQKSSERDGIDISDGRQEAKTLVKTSIRCSQAQPTKGIERSPFSIHQRDRLEPLSIFFYFFFFQLLKTASPENRMI